MLDLLVFLLSLLKPEITAIVLVLILIINGMLYALTDLETRGVLFVFLVSFFLILVGREALEVFGLHAIETVFKDELNRQAEWMIVISLASLFAGYALSGFFSTKKKKIPDHRYDSPQYRAIRKVSIALFLFTFAFNVFTLIDIVLFVFRNGYLNFYTSYESHVPYVIKKLGDMCLVCFWIFLATMPDKKSVNRASLLYIIYFLLTLGTGKRFPFVAGMLTLFVYYLARNRIHNDGQVWIKKKTIILMFVLAPLLFMPLYAIGQIRVGNSWNAFRVDKAISNFLYNQGVSINVIKRAQIYGYKLPEGRMYLFGSTYEAISNNIISRMLGFPQYTGNTVEHARNGYSFQHALSYIAIGSYYLGGHGLGSCYIAEAFHDLGYLGVVAVNVVYGTLFRKLFDFRRYGVWITTIIIAMLNSILLAPRGSADGFITDIVDLTTWGTILVVSLLSELILRGSGYKRSYLDESDKI